MTRDREKKRTILTIVMQRDSCNISSLELKTWIKCVTKESGNNFDFVYRKDLNQIMNRYLETNVTLQFIKQGGNKMKPSDNTRQLETWKQAY